MKTLLSFLLLLFATPTFAQLPSDFRTEQIFLCPKSTVCTSDDSIKADGFVTCDASDRIMPYSKYLYIELIDSNDSVLVRQKTSCKYGGVFHVAIPKDPAAEPGIYYLRAYTDLMRNFSPQSFAIQPILVNRTFPKRDPHVDNGVKCIVVPSGGKLVAGGIQGITVFATDGMDNPLSNMKVDLIDISNDTIATTCTSASGYATLNIAPQTGTEYRIVVQDNMFPQTVSLPPTSTDDIKIVAFLGKHALKYQILGNTERNEISKIYVYDRHDGLLQIANPQREGILKLDPQTHIATLFAVDKENNVIAEFTALGKSDEDNDTLATNYTINTGDSIHFRVPKYADCKQAIVRLVDYNELWAPQAERQVLYESDFSSPLPFPEHAFASKGAERWTDIQAWLATASFKRFKLKDAITKGDSIYTFMPEETMTFSGTTKMETGQNVKHGTIVAYNTENNMVYDSPIQPDGKFRIAVDDFKDGDTFFLQTVDKNGRPISSKINVDANTYPNVDLPHKASLPKDRYANDSHVEIGNGGIHDQVLPDIVVKARIRTEKIEPSNRFYRMNYANREEIEKHECQTPYDILRMMPGIRLRQEENFDKKQLYKTVVGDWGVYNTRGPSTFGKSLMVVLVDNLRLTTIPDMIMRTPAFEIEEVEVLQAGQALAYTFGAINGAVLVTTRKISQQRKVKSKGTYYTPKGLSVYTPDNTQQVPCPDRTGKYRLLVDVLTPKGVKSFEHEITVNKPH